MIAQERRRQSGRLVHEREREPALVAGPRVVDVEVVASELTDDLPAPQVDAEVAPGRAVGADRVAGGHIERPRGEPVGGRGERTYRADLDRVPGERAPEVLP